MGGTILIVEDDLRVGDLMVESLRHLTDSLGIALMRESNGASGEARAREYLPEVIILDLGLPELSGLGLLERLQSWYKGSVVVVTAWEDEANKLRAFELGAEDYVQKPFSPKELEARIRVALKRSNTTDRGEGAQFRVGDVLLELKEHRCQVAGGRELELTQTEFKFLSLLMRQEGRLCSQKSLLEQVWGPNHSQDTHYLRILVSKLRKKFSEAGSSVAIVTEPGLGYRLLGVDRVG